MESDETQTYIMLYCEQHNNGKLVDKSVMEEEYDLEGSLYNVASLLHICKHGVFKKTPCKCTVHGVINITDNKVTHEPEYGNPLEHTYPKGWKLKYYTNELKSGHTDYSVLCAYFHKPKESIPK